MLANNQKALLYLPAMFLQLFMLIKQFIPLKNNMNALELI